MRGGLARRAGLLDLLRKQASQWNSLPVLTLVGSHEFFPDRTFPDPAKTGKFTPDQIRTAYDHLKVDAGYLSPVAQQWFQPTLPAGFLPVHTDPVSKHLSFLLEKRHVEVIIVCFPALPEGSEDIAPPDLIEKVLQTAKREREAVNSPYVLVIGLSPWGFKAEINTMPKLGKFFHILFGSGPGVPLVAEVPSKAEMIWSRADKDGRGLIVLDLLRLPEPDQPWHPKESAWAKEIPLVPPLKSDPEIEKILKKE